MKVDISSLTYKFIYRKKNLIMYKYYLTLSDGNMNGKNTVLIDEVSFLDILKVKQVSDFSDVPRTHSAPNSKFIRISTDESIKNNEKIVQRVINVDHVISMNVAKVVEEVNLKAKNMSDVCHVDSETIDEYQKSFMTQNKTLEQRIEREVLDLINENSLGRKLLNVDILKDYFEVARYFRGSNGKISKNPYLGFPNLQTFLLSKTTEGIPIQLIKNDDFEVCTWRMGVAPRFIDNKDSFQNEDFIQQFIKDIAISFIIEEETEILKLIDASVPQSQERIDYNHKVKNNMDLALCKIDSHRINPTKIIFPNKLKSMAEEILGKKFIKNSLYDLPCEDFFLSGRPEFGTYKDIPVYLSALMPYKALVLADDIGVMPIRMNPQCIEVKHRNKYGFDISQEIGICINNPKGIAVVEYDIDWLGIQRNIKE